MFFYNILHFKANREKKSRNLLPLIPELEIKAGELQEKKKKKTGGKKRKNRFLAIILKEK